ncbi:Gfo/Idh/MocA family protein, partial [Enterococcus faecium]|uniref:Gfo/Idh/MocA family protein n=1 Tax=Enterococcus faecium TaxID=1352 RepID=UPI0030C7A431
IKVGMVGYKFMGKAHSHAYRDLPLFFPESLSPEMKVICGRNESEVAKAAAQFGWEESTTDWKNLLEREDIDLIDFNAPSDVNKEIAIAAAHAGKHIFCE